MNRNEGRATSIGGTDGGLFLRQHIERRRKCEEEELEKRNRLHRIRDQEERIKKLERRVQELR